jgi:hypothetical protein
MSYLVRFKHCNILNFHSPLAFLGTTSRLDLIDPAILRAGRFELHIKLGKLFVFSFVVYIRSFYIRSAQRTRAIRYIEFPHETSASECSISIRCESSSAFSNCAKHSEL